MQSRSDGTVETGRRPKPGTGARKLLLYQGVNRQWLGATVAFQSLAPRFTVMGLEDSHALNFIGYRPKGTGPQSMRT